MGINNIVRSKGFKNFMSKLYGWGAAIVLIGALFKITHIKGADAWLFVGLITEAVIFFFSAFEPPYVEPDWSLVYPELAGMYHVDDEDEKKPVIEELDDMLANAKIGPELIASLGAGMRNLGDNAAKIANFTDAGATTEDYLKNVKSATESIGNLDKTYKKTSDVLDSSVETLARSAEAIDFAKIDGTAYSQQMQKVAENLEALNSVYELQLKNTTDQATSYAKMQEGMSRFVENVEESIATANTFSEETTQLNKNLEALNRVYGNMLSAMNVNR